MDPRNLSFEQREGLQPLPTQLQRGEISKELRAKLWEYVHATLHPQENELYHGRGGWSKVLRSVHVDRYHRAVDRFNAFQTYQGLGELFFKADYAAVYGWLDFVMRHPEISAKFAERIGAILADGRSAYRVVDKMIVPLASDEERASFEQALANAGQDKFPGARRHLQQAGTALTNGDYANSIRESIHAVESVARVLEPSGEFGKAMAKLETKIAMHPALKRGFSAIYGYASDEGGIRHALLESGHPAVDEVDAIFFLGACSSFVSYLIGKARIAGLA